MPKENQSGIIRVRFISKILDLKALRKFMHPIHNQGRRQTVEILTPEDKTRMMIEVLNKKIKDKMRGSSASLVGRAIESYHTNLIEQEEEEAPDLPVENLAIDKGTNFYQNSKLPK